MLGQRFLYFIRVGTDFLSVKNGKVITGTEPIPLAFTPSGWQEISILTERNKTYFGLDRSFTIPLEFVEDGAAIYTYLVGAKGYSVVITQIIAERKVSYDFTATPVPTFRVWYDLFYAGEADVPSYQKQDPKVTMNFVEGGPGKYIKKNEKVNYEIPVDEKEITYDGINLIGKQNLVPLDGFLIDSNLYRQVIIPFILGTTEGNSVGLSFFQTQYENAGANVFSYFETSPNYFILENKEEKKPIEIRLEGVLKVKLTIKRTRANWWLRFVKVKKDFKASELSDAKLTYYQIASINGTGYVPPIPPPNYSISVQGGSVEIPINISITMEPGDRLFPMLTMDNIVTGPDQSAWEFLEGSKISANYVNRAPASVGKANTLLTTFKRLVLSSTDNLYTADSTLLKEKEFQVLLTSGMAIRQTANPVMATNLVDFFESVNTIMNVGMGVIDGIVRLEKKEFWFNLTTKPLVNTGKPKFSVAQDYLFNQLFVGFEPTSLEDVNGRNDVHNTLEFSVDSPMQQELKIISPYIASCYQIEYLRIKLDGQDTTDNPKDKNGFFVDVKASNPENTKFILNRDLNARATGLLSGTKDSVFNLALTPKRCFWVHAWYIHSCFYRQDGQMLKFQTALNNKDLSTSGTTTENYLTDDIIESASVLIGNLPPQKFIPWIIEVETVVPEGYKPLSTDGYVFTYKRNQWAGIAIKSGIQPYINKAQTFTLLALASNNMEKM